MREKKTVPGFPEQMSPLSFRAGHWGHSIPSKSLPGEAGLPQSSGGQWIPQAVGAGPTGHGDPWALGRLKRRQDDGRARDRQPWTKDQPPVQEQVQGQAKLKKKTKKT